jgi:hypothetical protein
MFNYIRNIFVKKKKKTFNTITFGIDNNGKVYIDLHIDNISSFHSEKFGFLMYLINESFYLQPMIDAVVALSDNPDYREFSESTIKSWNIHAIKNNEHPLSLENPIIKPSKFVKI